jgi:hypothetical protein
MSLKRLPYPDEIRPKPEECTKPRYTGLDEVRLLYKLAQEVGGN